MSDQLAQIADIPREFMRDGTQFINRCTKRTLSRSFPPFSAVRMICLSGDAIADKKEFIKISQAVGIGFVVMGVIGYIVKVIHIPINNILVYVASPLLSI